jgi:TIR domain
MAKGTKGAASKGSAGLSYRVFVSHAGEDVWLAEQIAKRLNECGASTFLDRRDIAAGDNFKARIRDEVPKCDELLALFTPWSRTRAWVRHEIGMADMLGKRIVCVFYKVTLDDFRQDDDGLGPLDDLNVIDINTLDVYFDALTKRARIG